MSNLHDMEAESLAFDRQIGERVAHGHIPDLRYSGRCEWFQCNPWRDNAYIQMVDGERCRYVVKHVPPGSRLLEVGMGPGALSLELAREGFDVTGIDISGECVEQARKTCLADYPENRNLRLRYVHGNFLAGNLAEKFDAIIFSGAFHHFPNPADAAKAAAGLLSSGGLIILMEPCRELLDTTSVAIRYLVESLLGAANAYWKTPELVTEQAALCPLLQNELQLCNYKNDDGSNVQSPHDMSATRQQMLDAVAQYFACLQEEWEYSFYADMIGGLRLATSQDEVLLARHLQAMDRWLMEHHVIQPSNFRWVGQLH